MELIFLGLGIALGVFAGLVPGMHPALFLALVIGTGIGNVVGPGPVISLIAGAAGVILYLKRLGAVYHVNAGDEQAVVEPALRMTAAGKASTALRIMTSAADLALAGVVVVAIVILFLTIFKVDVVKAVDGVLRGFSPIILCFWLLTVVLRSKRRLLTVLGLVAMGTLGYGVLHAPALAGNPHQLAPLMTGVFAIPIAWSSWTMKGSLPPQLPFQPVAVNLEVGVIGVVIGLISGLIAGLGAGSIVSLFSSHVLSPDLPEEEFDINYLLMAAASETADDLMAVLLVLTSGIGRSGEAIILGRATGVLTPGSSALVFGCVLVSALIGRKLVYVLEPWYHKLVCSQSPKLWASIVFIGAGSQLVATGQWLCALGFTVAGACISFWCREHKLSQQVSFGVLVIPLLLMEVGAVPAINQVLFP